jgi:hypothetical protein
MSSYLPNKLNHFYLVKIFLLEHGDLAIDHPFVKIGNIERVKFLHNEIQARKYVIAILIGKHLKFIIYSSKQMILLFMNFRTTLMKLN